MAYLSGHPVGCVVPVPIFLAVGLLRVGNEGPISDLGSDTVRP